MADLFKINQPNCTESPYRLLLEDGYYAVAIVARRENIELP